MQVPTARDIPRLRVLREVPTAVSTATTLRP